MQVGDVSDVLGKQWQPIGPDEARGNSQAMTSGSVRKMAKLGKQQLDQAAANSHGAPGLNSNWDAVKEHAYNATREDWGGTTVDAKSGSPVEHKQGYSLAVREPGQDQISVHANASREHFNSAMNEAKERYGHQLGSEGGELGVFHDSELHRIDIDPARTVPSKKQANAIGSYTHAAGGAYEHTTGDAHWIPHAKG